MSHRSVFVAVILLQLLQGGAENLTAWLQGLSIDLPRDLPNISIQLPFGYDLVLHIEGGTCNDMTAGGVQVKNANTTMEEISFEVELSGLGISCHILADAALQRHRALVGTGPISVALRLASNSSVDIGTRTSILQDAAAPLPAQVELSHWSSELHISTLHFSGRSLPGRLVAAMLDSLRPLLRAERFVNATMFTAASWLCRGPLSRAVMNLSNSVRSSGVLRPATPLPAPALGAGAVDLHQLLHSGTFAHVMQSLLEDVFHVSDVNYFMRILQKALAFMNPTLPSGKRFHLRWVTQFGSLHVDGDPVRCSVQRPAMFGEVSAHVVHPHVDMESMKCLTHINVSFLPSGSIIHASVLNMSLDVSAWATDVDVNATVLAAMSRKQLFASYELDQMQHVGCMLRALVPTDDPRIPGLAFLDLSGSVVKPRLGLAARGEDMLLGDLCAVIVAGFFALSTGLQPAIALLLRGNGMAMLRDVMNNRTAAKVERPSDCPATNFSTGLYEPVTLAAEGFTGAFFAAGVMATAATAAAAVKARRSAPNTGTGTVRQGPAPASNQTASARLPIARHSTLGASLSRQRIVSTRASRLLSVVTLGTIGLFCVSATGMQVVLRAKAHTDSPSPGSPSSASLQDIFDFTMWKVLENFWLSGCYPLLILVSLWSILWPVAKLIMLLYCWHAPARLLSPMRRGPLLLFLDQVGKFSLFDPFLFIMFLVGLRLKWQGHDIIGGDPGLARFTLAAEPGIGFYFLFLGTILSLAIGECMLWCHREAEQVRTRYEAAATPRSTPLTTPRITPHTSLAGSAVTSASPAREPLVDGHAQVSVITASEGGNAHALSEPLAAPLSGTCEAGWTCRALIWVLVLCAFGVTICSVVVAAYAYRWSGVIGAAKLVLKEPIEDTFSIFDVLRGLLWSYSETFLSKAAVCFLFTAFGFFVILAPVLHTSLVMALWVVPLKPRRQYQCYVAAVTCGAWSAMDVFTIAVLASMLGGEEFGIQSFIQFIVEHGNGQPICDFIKDNFNVKCIGFSPGLLPGVFVLVGAAVLQHLAGHAVSREFKRILDS
mmetsp:Transcript_43312/g.80771  ORF Transcript_43312/g.80771 Transcript_43312/m.80771 type:complete len:1057 (+) Transcript_43312:58-3228(+)